MALEVNCYPLLFLGITQPSPSKKLLGFLEIRTSQEAEHVLNARESFYITGKQVVIMRSV